MEEMVGRIASMEENQHDFQEMLIKEREELWEILIRDHEEHCEQMSQMMQILKRMARDKAIVDNDNFVSLVVLTQGTYQKPQVSSHNTKLISIDTPK